MTKILKITSLTFLLSFFSLSSQAITIKNAGNYWEYFEVWANSDPSNDACLSDKSSDPTQLGCTKIYAINLGPTSDFIFGEQQMPTNGKTITKVTLKVKNKSFTADSVKDIQDKISVSDMCEITIKEGKNAKIDLIPACQN